MGVELTLGAEREAAVAGEVSVRLKAGGQEAAGARSDGAGGDAEVAPRAEHAAVGEGVGDSEDDVAASVQGAIRVVELGSLEVEVEGGEEGATEVVQLAGRNSEAPVAGDASSVVVELRGDAQGARTTAGLQQLAALVVEGVGADVPGVGLAGGVVEHKALGAQVQVAVADDLTAAAGEVGGVDCQRAAAGMADEAVAVVHAGSAEVQVVAVAVDLPAGVGEGAGECDVQGTTAGLAQVATGVVEAPGLKAEFSCADVGGSGVEEVAGLGVEGGFGPDIRAGQA